MAAAVPLSLQPQDVAAGAALYERLACDTCHALGARSATSVMPAAPDLGLARVRMEPEDAAAYIADPAAFGGDPRMPRYPITALEAARLRDFLWAAPTARAAATKPPELPLLQRPVRYAEVRQVLDAVCVHCHMDPRSPANRGDGGPGNTGGLGWSGAGLDLETWAGIRRGVRTPDGRRLSILTARDGGEPPLVERLRRRNDEHLAERAGTPLSTARPGMPLGLPPLSAADLQLVRSWLTQGAPGPASR